MLILLYETRLYLSNAKRFFFDIKAPGDWGKRIYQDRRPSTVPLSVTFLESSDFLCRFLVMQIIQFQCSTKCPKTPRIMRVLLHLCSSFQVIRLKKRIGFRYLRFLPPWYPPLEPAKNRTNPENAAIMKAIPIMISTQ